MLKSRLKKGVVEDCLIEFQASDEYFFDRVKEYLDLEEASYKNQE
jgi:hypothetical protein